MTWPWRHQELSSPLSCSDVPGSTQPVSGRGIPSSAEDRASATGHHLSWLLRNLRFLCSGPYIRLSLSSSSFLHGHRGQVSAIFKYTQPCPGCCFYTLSSTPPSFWKGSLQALSSPRPYTPQPLVIRSGPFSTPTQLFPSDFLVA